MWLTLGSPTSQVLRTLTCGSIIWCRRRMRLLTGLEKAAVQGFCYYDIVEENRLQLDQGKLTKLAGDSFNAYILILVWFVFLSILPLAPPKF